LATPRMGSSVSSMYCNACFLFGFGQPTMMVSRREVHAARLHKTFSLRSNVSEITKYLEDADVRLFGCGLRRLTMALYTYL
jgi:hypothetical protein